MILDHTNWSFAHDAVADVDTRLEPLRELATIWKSFIVSVNLNDEICTAFLVDWGNGRVSSRDTFVFNVGMDGEMAAGPETGDPVWVRELERDKVRVMRLFHFLAHFQRELIIFIPLNVLKKTIRRLEIVKFRTWWSFANVFLHDLAHVCPVFVGSLILRVHHEAVDRTWV